jgi:hypothetical protein
VYLTPLLRWEETEHNLARTRGSRIRPLAKDADPPERLGTLEETRRAIQDWSRYACVREEVLIKALASWYAGLTPSISGATSLNASQAVRRAFFDGNTFSTTLHAGIMNTSQLVAEGGSCSLRVFLNQLDPNGASALTIFDCANHAMVDSTLIPLIRYIQDPSYSQAFGLWPKCCHTLVTLTTVEYSLPVPVELWSYCTYIDSGDEAVPLNDFQALPPTSVPRPGLISSAVLAGADPQMPFSTIWRDVLAKLSPSLRLSPTFARRVDRFDYLASKLTSDMMANLNMTIECCLCASFASLPEGEVRAVADFLPSGSTFLETLEFFKSAFLKRH